METTLRGWQAASRAVGLPIRTLRRLLADGILHGMKAGDGVWEFDIGALEAAAAVARSGNVPSAVEPVMPTAVAAAIDYAGDPAEPELDMPEPEVAAPDDAERPQIAPWLLAATADAPSTGPEPARATGTRTPLGSSLRHGPSWLDMIPTSPRSPSSAPQLDAARTHAEADALRAQLAQRDQQLHHQAQQVAQQAHQIQQLQATVQQLTVALRGAQIGHVAQALAIESLHGAAAARVIPEHVVGVTIAIRDAATHALAQLPPEHLGSPHAWAVGRHAAQIATAQIARESDDQATGAGRGPRRGPRGVDRGGN